MLILEKTDSIEPLLARILQVTQMTKDGTAAVALASAEAVKFSSQTFD